MWAPASLQPAGADKSSACHSTLLGSVLKNRKTTFFFDFHYSALLQNVPQLFHHPVLVPCFRKARVKGKRVQLPRCPATVTGET